MFNLFVLGMLALDLGVFHRKSHEVRVKEALIWSAVWISLAGVFNVLIYFWKGKQTALEFLTGYVIEKSLSVDNIFVFLMIFSYFSVPARLQHKVLFWGIIGALVMRAALIAAGAKIIHEYHWVIYIFGAFLILTGIKMLLKKEDGVHPEKNPLIRIFKRFMPVTPDYVEDRFFVRRAGRLAATPLFLTLLMVETTDLIFAVDSIPAIFAVTKDPFIVYTSNVFAILGLRSLYFALSGVMGMFRYLKTGLSFVLVFVGFKMILSMSYKIPVGASLGIIVAILAASIIASVLMPRKAAGPAEK